MKTVYSPLHHRRTATSELDGGLLIEPHERPSRAETILRRVTDQALGEIIEPDRFALEPILRIHSPEYVAFLATCWQEWSAAGKPGEASPVLASPGHAPTAHVRH